MMLLNFIATNEDEALWVSFSDGNGIGVEALFLKKMKKKLCGFRFLMEMEPGLEPFS